MRRFAILPIGPEVQRLLQRISTQPKPKPAPRPSRREALLAAVERHKKQRIRARRDRRRREFRKLWMGE